ncbi:MAG: hypothetical protein Alis3KO_41420 [Aliiglaciecola sp.]
MDIEEIEIDGQLISVSLPVSDLIVDRNTVKYKDANGNCEESFSTSSLARKFMLILTELQ